MLNKLIKIVAGLLILLLVFVLAFNLEFRQVVVNKGPTIEVQTTPYLAAASYLEVLGKQVEHRSTPLDPASLSLDEVLLIANQNAVADQQTAEDLFQWVQEGGHLIWTLTGYNEGEISYLAELSGIEIQQPSESGKNVFTDTESPLSQILRERNEQLLRDSLEKNRGTLGQTEEAIPTPRELVRLDIETYDTARNRNSLPQLPLSDTGEAATLNLISRYSIHHPSMKLDSPTSFNQGRFLYGAETGSGFKLVHLSFGQGKVTVLTSSTLWTNGQIGRLDHAFALEQLVGTSAAIIFQNSSNWPSLLSVLMEFAGEAMLILGLILIAVLVQRSVRFGPSKSDLQETRRSIAEHIGGVAKFHWRHGYTDFLLAPMRKAVFRRMRRQFADFDQLPEAEKIQRICKISEYPQEEVEIAFGENTISADWQFSQSVQLLEKIRKVL